MRMWIAGWALLSFVAAAPQGRQERVPGGLYLPGGVSAPLKTLRGTGPEAGWKPASG